MAINSHIQLPNSILKYFRDESDSEKKVWYLDISSGSIMKAASNKIGTSKGYYSDFGENFWNRTVEDTLAKLNHKFYKIHMQKENAEIGSLPMSQDDKDIIKKYIKAAMVSNSFVVGWLFHLLRSIVIHLFCCGALLSPFGVSL